jgi:hypothetical protein
LIGIEEIPHNIAFEAPSSFRALATGSARPLPIAQRVL